MTRSEDYDRLRSDLLHLIPPNAKLVVEMGCGKGETGAAYKRINPHGEYVGIELRPEAASVAASRLDRVVTGSIEELDANSVGIVPGSVDYLVYGDLLAHLRDPWAILRHHAQWLREGGCVCASIPNVQHSSILLDLLRGKWNYAEEDVLDQSHLRFFTLESIEALFAQAGLSVYDLRSAPLATDHWPQVRDLLAPVLDALGVDRKRFAQLTETVQYLVAARRGDPPTRRLLIQTLMGCPTTCGRVRVLEPDRFSSTVPGVRTIATVENASFDVIEPNEEKVFILQRVNMQYPGNLDTLRALLARDYVVVTELDDDPHHWDKVEANRYLSFRGVHAVQTTTGPLAEFFRQHNPNVAVFPNQLAELPPPRKYAEDETVTLFFGALNREDDRNEILPALRRVLRDYGRRVRIRVIYDREFFEALPTESKDFTPFCPYEQYIDILRSSDIGLLPLLPTRFNSMKSDLKFIECAGHGVVTLASPVVYEKTLRDGETGVLFRTAEEFEERLRSLIDNVDTRRRIADNAYEYVARERLLSQHYRERTEWYWKLRDELPRLNEELRRRVPELFD